MSPANNSSKNPDGPGAVELAGTLGAIILALTLLGYQTVLSYRSADLANRAVEQAKINRSAINKTLLILRLIAEHEGLDLRGIEGSDEGTDEGTPRTEARRPGALDRSK